MSEPTTPVDEDVHATVPELLARAHADYSQGQAASSEHQAQGGTGQREGVLPGSAR